MKKRSLGLIETWGYVPAVEAVDAGTKAANVTFLGYEITR
ncbi:MAG: BMC domain-containing protein, partial [Desulfosarcina sp.]|nr:BMC domain-containing protein [Desulfosarcina sp.]MBC2766906.1 BMC domain-containing protein [Desulfosarcina sp.]